MMTAIRRYLPTAALFAAVITLPASVNAAERPDLPALAYELPSFDIAPEAAAPAPAPADVIEAQLSDKVDPVALACMAKVVHHESRGQPRRGQLAVAQTLINRLHDGRFGGSICAVANQRGQFFDTASYHPREDSADWKTAVDVARDTLNGNAEDAAPGVLYFHAASYSPTGFWRGRQRIATIGAQVFYR